MNEIENPHHSQPELPKTPQKDSREEISKIPSHPDDDLSGIDIISPWLEHSDVKMTAESVKSSFGEEGLLVDDTLYVFASFYLLAAVRGGFTLEVIANTPDNKTVEITLQVGREYAPQDLATKITSQIRHK